METVSSGRAFCPAAIIPSSYGCSPAAEFPTATLNGGGFTQGQAPLPKHTLARGFFAHRRPGNGETMARIKGLRKNKAGVIARIAYSWTKRLLGKIPEPMTITAHHTKVFSGNMFFETMLMKSHKVDDRLKALAEIKVATL